MSLSEQIEALVERNGRVIIDKCEVCLRDGDIKELRAEVARLRSVCMEAATTVRRVGYMTTDVYSAMLVQAAKTLAEAGKEAMR